jgi:hypothetical protein
LPIRLIGWIFTIAGTVTLMFGVMALRKLHKAGMLKAGRMDSFIVNDMILLGIWSMSLFAGLGVLNYRTWAPVLLEYFCWVMIALTIITAYTRISTTRDAFRRESPGEKFLLWPMVAGALIVIVPVTVVGGLTVYSLRNDGLQKEYRAKAAEVAQGREGR